MARLTVEDCLQNIENRFELVIKATRRARDLSLGGEALVPWGKDKTTVIALREIAAGVLPEQNQTKNAEAMVKQAFISEEEVSTSETENTPADADTANKSDTETND